MSHKEDECHKKKDSRFPNMFCKQCLKSKIDCRCCNICAPQPCHCQKQELNPEQKQDAVQVPIQTGSALEATQAQDQEQNATQEGSDQDQELTTLQVSKQDGGDSAQEQNAVQEGSDQDQAQDQNTIQVSKQEGADTDQEQNTTQNPIIIGPSPDQETSQNTDTTSTLNTMVTPTIMSDPETTTTLDTTVTPTITSDPETTTTTTLDTTVTPTIMSDPETTTTTTLDTTVTPTIMSDPETTTTVTPTIMSDPETNTTLDTTVTPTITNTTDSSPTTNQNPTQMTSQEGQTQEQSETQTQTLGDQLQAQGLQAIQGHTNDSPLNNTQTISTSVSGVTVNLNVECGCNEKKNRKQDHCEGCDCCTSSIATLLQMVQTAQANIPLPIDKQITIYTNTLLPITNPITNQVLTNVNDCISVTFKNSDQVTATPNTTLQISTIAGISAVNDIAITNDIFDFLLGIANNCSNFQKENRRCECDSICNCGHNSCCSNTLHSELEAFATVGLKINLFIRDLSTSIDNLFVLKICDCLAFFVDDLTTPTTIYVFSLCSIAGYTVPPQTLS
ncbi:hypothetical protein [Bacillus mobilis]|uniref:hypothetical protein n=1 Tax=Bacillus mobilis TaxID=2026190 RepID=UPI0036BC0DFB